MNVEKLRLSLAIGIQVLAIVGTVAKIKQTVDVWKTV